MEKIQENKEKFKQIWNKFVSRDGRKDILNYLESTDFFEAPASTKYHGAYPGGLAEHSLNVYYRLLAKGKDMPDGIEAESLTIVSLLHDICKTNFYKLKEAEGQQSPKYYYDNKLPIGHGEKSVILIQRHMYLTEEEIVAISWHMGGFDVRAKALTQELSQVWERYPLAFLLHIADMEATWLDERSR